MCVSFACCQTVVSAAGRSLIQRSPTKCGVSKCDREASNNVSNIITCMKQIQWQKCRSVDQNNTPSPLHSYNPKVHHPVHKWSEFKLKP